jgi:hypothetical protein
MKSIKIILAIAVVALIGFFVWKFSGTTPPLVDVLKNSTNPWVKDIKAQIDSAVPKQINFVKARECYVNIQMRINDNYQNKRLCEILGDEASNEKSRHLLSESLYASYFKKFVELTDKVFNGSEWESDNLTFIGKEIDKLKRSPHFDGKDYQGNSVKKINAVLSKYREITIFIAACNKFSYSHYGLLDSFPDVSDKVQKSRTYLANNLDNHYVNNCTRLKDGLKNIPKTLFDKHTYYLCTKIQTYGGKYTEYNSQPGYSDTIYTPLSKQISVLSDDIYGVGYSTSSSGYEKLEKKLDDFNLKAFETVNLNNR